MAKWTTSTYDTTLEARVFADVMNESAIDIAREKKALLYAVLGNRVDDGKGDYGPGTGSSFERLERVEGLHKAIRLMNDSETWAATGHSVAAQMGAVTPSFDDTKFGMAQFDLTLYSKPVFVPLWDKRKSNGSASFGQDYMAEEIRTQVASFQRQLNSEMNANQNQAGTTVGGVPYALQSASTNTYLNIDRSDADNANFRAATAQSGASMSTLGAANLWAAIETLGANGGNAKLAVFHPTDMNFLRQSLDNVYSVNAMPRLEGWSEYGGRYLNINGVAVVSDPDCNGGSAGTGYVIDPEWWTVYMNEDGFSVNGFERSHLAVAALQSFIDVGFAFVCKSPKHGGILITSIAS